MLFNRSVISYGILGVTVMVMAAILAADKLSIGKVLGQQAEGNINNNTSATVNAEAIKVSIVPGAAALGDKAYSPNPINISVGDTITWTNNDTSDAPFHTVTAGSGPDDENKGQEFDSGRGYSFDN
jgi:plastocyanin